MISSEFWRQFHIILLKIFSINPEIVIWSNFQ